VTIIVITTVTSNGQPGEVVKLLDVSDRSIASQERSYWRILVKYLDSHDVTMYCPQNKPGLTAEDFFAEHPDYMPTNISKEEI